MTQCGTLQPVSWHASTVEVGDELASILDMLSFVHSMPTVLLGSTLGSEQDRNYFYTRIRGYQIAILYRRRRSIRRAARARINRRGWR